jgi:hypothetical protein
VIGDFGANTEGEAQVAQLVRGWQPDFVVTTGDNNYPAGEARTIDVNIGKFYADFIGDYKGAFGKGSKTNRFWPSLGNHDQETPGATPYREYFSLPGNERYYDVDTGLVHLFALDSDRREPDGTSSDSKQADWLKKGLASSRSCFDVVYFHHPPYSSGAHGPSAFMRWPFRAWGAEVVLSGHDHTYERFDIEGFPYIVNGLGGAEKYPFEHAAGEASKFRYNSGYGAMLVVANQSGITYEFWTVDGAKLDTLTVPKTCGNQ